MLPAGNMRARAYGPAPRPATAVVVDQRLDFGLVYLTGDALRPLHPQDTTLTRRVARNGSQPRRRVGTHGPGSLPLAIAGSAVGPTPIRHPYASRV
jgi:hypothetical protein